MIGVVVAIVTVVVAFVSTTATVVGGVLYMESRIREEVATATEQVDDVAAQTNAESKAVWRAIADLRTEVASTPSGEAPRWFVERVDRLEQKFEAKFDTLAIRVGRLEGGDGDR